MLKFPLPLTHAPPPCPDPEPAPRNPPPSPQSWLSPRPSLFSWPLTCCHPHILPSTGPPELTNYFYRSLGREEFNMIRTGSHILSHLTLCKVIFQNWHVLSNQYFHSQTRSTAKLPNHIIGCHNWIHNYLMLYLSSFFAHNLCGLMPLMQKSSLFCINIVFLDLIFLPTLLLQTPPASWPREVFVISYICLYFSVFVFACICI